MDRKNHIRIREEYGKMAKVKMKQEEEVLMETKKESKKLGE